MDTKKHIRELLPVYLDQMCSEEEKKAVESHLSGCVECRQELEDLRQTIKLVTSLKEIEPPDNLWKGVAERIEKKPFWKIPVWSRFTGVAVATMAILFLAVTVNKYSTRIAEQAKSGVQEKVVSGGNIPLLTPFLPEKPAQSLEKKVVSKAETRPAPAVDAMRYNEEVAGKEDESGYARAPQEAVGLTSVSRQKGQLLDKDTRGPSSYVIEMEVEDMERTRQRLQALAESYRARRVAWFGDDQDLFYHVQQQQLSSFIQEVNKLGGDPRSRIEPESLWDPPVANTLGSGNTADPQLIRIKFNTTK